MAEKARLFDDEDSLERILEADEPRTQKALGRSVQGFDVDGWEEDEENGRPRCWNIVWRANMANFSQNPHLLQDLLDTDGTTIVEASPYDCIWGIGLSASDPRAGSREAWRGANRLGEHLQRAGAAEGVEGAHDHTLAPAGDLTLNDVGPELLALRRTLDHASTLRVPHQASTEAVGAGGLSATDANAAAPLRGAGCCGPLLLASP